MTERRVLLKQMNRELHYYTSQKEFLVTKTEFKETIANTKAEIIKWMFIFWIGQIGAILGILFIFFK
ncbi:MAG: hypothetical protein ABH808_03785 [Candidatus Kuenenbacteria bacterium]